MDTNNIDSTEKSKLMVLFTDQLKDIYWAEKALIKALPKMAEKATDPELVLALEDHLAETHGQIESVEEVFGIIGKKPEAKKCEAMEGLLKEGEEIVKSTDKGAMRDAGIIAACQKVEHYEIATYGTLRTFARTLEFHQAATILEAVLQQEKNADEKLTEIAVKGINLEASSMMK